MPVLDRKELEESPLSDLHAIASELGIEGYRRLRRDDLIDALAGGSSDFGGAAAKEDEDKPKPRARSRSRSRVKKTDDKPAEDRSPRRRAAAKKDDEADEAPARGQEDDDGDTEVRQGVLDILPNGSGFMRPDAFAHSRDDVYVSPAQIRRLELRAGDQVEGPVRSPRRNERHPSLVRVDKVN